MNIIPGINLDGIGLDGFGQGFLKDRQTISITDVLSEGPIYGLVEGSSSVYLNDDRVVPLSEAGAYYSQSAALATFTADSPTVTISGAGTQPILESETGDKYLIVRGGHGYKSVVASNGSAGTDNYAITATLTTSDGSDFFTDSMISTPVDVDTHVPARLGIVASGGTGDGAFGEGWITKRTSNSVAEFVPGGPAGPSGMWIPNGTYYLSVDKIVKISAISGTTITLASNWTGLGGAYKFDVTGAIVTKLDPITQTQTTNYEGVTTQFRVGTLAQTPFSGQGGSGSTSISNSLQGNSLLRSDNYGGSDAPKVLVGSSNAGFRLTASQLQEVDEARFTIAYSGGHYAVGGEGGDNTTFTRYRTMIAIKKPGESSFEAYQVLKHPLVHQSLDKNAVSFVETVDLTAFRPFSDFKIQVERISNHEGPAFKTETGTFHDWTQVTASSLTNTTCVIKDVLTHPFTALAKVSFDTKKFQSTPIRSYHLRGLKVSIPSNYITREQTSDNVANYNRNITSGAITTSYQDWDGAFASEKVYTNNPAWVFYDILTNNRYGLGEFLKDTDIDKYALYRIARYCDVLVDDGKGGLEPRFTANLYFTKAADAYKVLKDIATVFRSMLYYIDGKVVPVMDSPAGPVYNFTKSNVIEGKFSYEGTGSKTRINQCIVTWIDPDANYKASPLLVEDRLNIAETGTIISQNAMAMGATSEGQALRYGRWKLWTAANQREVVSFSTALNATFLVPGDIINVQDADRYAVRIGGRVSNSGTARSITSIPLDSTTTLAANSTYNLSVIFIEPGAFRTEDVYNTATPPVKTHSKGDLVKQAYLTGSSSLQDIDTEVKASNALETSGGEPLNLAWSETTRVETQEVSTVAGNVDTLTVTTAFSAVPAAESVWVLTETAGSLKVLGSAKEYKVLAISQNSKNEFGINAVEHYNEKFAAVDEDFTTYLADTVYPAVRHTDIVPPVRDVSSTASLKVGGGKEVAIQWIPPLALGKAVNAASGAEDTTLGLYEHISGYEITHTFPGIESPVLINSASQTSWSIDNVLDGTYEVAVKVVNVLQNVSVALVASVTVSDEYDENIPRLPEGVPYTGDIDSAVEISSSGSFTITTTDYIFNHPSPYAPVIQGVDATTATHTHDCSNMAVTTKTAQANEGEFIVEHYYVMMDSSDASDRLKLLKYHKSTTGGASFWYDTGTGNTTDKYGSNLTGTFLKGTDSSKVIGTGTSFLSEIKEGDVLQLGTEDIRVASVKSDTILFLSSATSTFHNNVTGKIPNIRIDKKNDCIIARVYKTGADAYSRFNYAKRSAIGSIDGNPALTARLTATQYVIPYDSTDNENTTITFTATATNFGTDDRTYKFYVDDGTTTTLKQTTTNTLDTHTFVLADGDEPANGAQITIKLEIIQGSTTAIDSTSIYGVKDGESAFTVVFTNEAHTIPADEDGLALTYANSGTDIRVFKGSTRLTYATSGANTFEVAVLSDTDITVNASPTTEQFAIANDTRRYGIASGMANADTSASITYSITARSDDAIDTVLTKVQSFTKGNAGPGAKVVNLTASQYVIPYDLANDETTTITLTATAKNISGSKIYKFYVNDGSTTTLIPGTGTTGGTQTTTGNAVTCNIPQNLEPANGEQITVRVDIVQASAVISTDSTSIYGIKDGENAFTVILTNESHTIPATNTGAPKTFANSGTDIRVFLGSTALAYGTGASEFTVAAANGTSIVQGTPSTVGTYTRSFDVASGMANSASSDKITYTITAKNGEGTATVLTKVQSFTKGNDGAAGQSTLRANLSNDNHTIPADFNGANGNYTGASTTLTILEGTTDVTSSWSITTAVSSGTTISGANTASVAVTAMGTSTTSGTVTFTATKSGTTLTAVFSVTKQNAAEAGDPAIVYRIGGATGAVTKNTNGTFTPANFTATAQKVDGENTPVALTSGGTLNVYRNGSNSTSATSTSGNVSWGVTSGTTTIKVDLVVGTTIVDSETIPIVSDGTSLIKAELSTPNVIITANNDGTVPSGNFAGSGTTLRVFEGNTPLDYANSGTTAGTFAIGSGGVVSSGLTRANPIQTGSSGSRYAVYGDITALTVDAGTITFNITGKKLDGTALTPFSIVQTFSKSKAGDAGGGVNLAFIRSSTQPTGSFGTGALPSNFNSIAWTDSPTASGAQLWASKGNLTPATGAWAWSTPAYRVDGAAAVEVYFYSDIVNPASPPSFAAPTYDFTSNAAVSVPSGWNTSPPSLVNDGDTVYVVVVLYAGSPSDTAATAQTTSGVSVYAQKTDGADGGTVNFAFIRSTGAPTTTPSTIEPITYPSNSWYDDASNATGAGVLYAIKGTLSGTTWTWGTAYALDGAVAKELYIYNLNVQSPTTNGSYQFADTSSAAVWTTPTGGWSKSPPSLDSDGDIVYVSAAVVTGDPGSTVTPSWSAGVVHSQRDDGIDGVSLNLTASPVLFTKDGTTYDPGSTSTLSLSAFGGTITSVAWTTSAGTLGATTGNSTNTLTFAANRSIVQINASATISAVVTGTDSKANTGVSFGTITAKISTSIQGADGGVGNTGFMYFFQNNGNDPVSGTIPSDTYEAGQIAIVENTATPSKQAGFRYSGSAWVPKELINTGIIVADAIKAEQLQISNDQTGSAGIFMDYNSGNSRIDIRDASGLRVRIGYLG